jgi:glycosyltransferase involved in cell wall biosynthesis
VTVAAPEATAGRSRPVRFCMITTFYPPFTFGGDGINVQRLSHALARLGHHVTVVHDLDAWRTLSRGKELLPSEPEPDGVEVVALESGLGALSPLLTQQTGRPLANRRRLRRLLGSDRFDVINFHNVSLVGGPGILSMGSALKLYTAREHWLVCPTHVLFRHRREPCDRRECVRCTLAYRRPPQLWRYTGFLERQLSHVDAFIALSEFSRRKHAEFGFPREMEVVPNLLPLDGGGPLDAEPPHPRPYFLFVGRLERLKGLDDVIPLFRGHEGPDLVIAGDGDHAAELRRLASGAPRVVFLGRVPQRALAPYYHHALALIAPSVGYESFGVTVIEAFRHGTPALVRRIGPYPDLLDHSGGGRVFDGPDDLLDAMHELERDAASRRALGRAAREAFERNWSEPAVISQYIDVVRRAAERTGRTELAHALSGESSAGRREDRGGERAPGAA